ncbi:MAG: rod shape-determining protein MreC [bacterium]|nr:rod shape-determining protein MreC [bacterium]
MKRTFLAKRNALLSSTSISWGVIALVFAVLALLVRLLAPNFFWQAAAPAFRVAGTINTGMHVFLNSFGDVAALAVRNEQLVSENASLAHENQVLREKETRINALDGIQKGIIAAVIASPPESPYDTLVLAEGERSGVALGQEAFGEGGVPLGVVTAITADFARVTLFSAPGTLTHGWIGPSGVPVNIEGTGAGTMKASFSRSAGIAVGDTVFAPGPGMLPIGSVVRVDSDPSAPGVTLRIMPKANPFSIAWVQLRDVGGALRNSFLTATSTL